MEPILATRPSLAARLGGATYIAASVGFLLVFSWLAARFGYPDVLDRPAAEVLPQLLALGATGRAVWIVYAILPLTLIAAAVGAAEALGHQDGRNASALKLGVLLQVVAALAMTLGLARWSTAQWALAEAWPLADGAQRQLLATVFDALNSYLGNAIGEFVGELALYGSFAAFALALWRVGGRKMAVLGGVTAVLGLLGMFRNITPVVQPAADVTNVLLPGFLIAFGVAVMRRGETTAGSSRMGIP